MTYYKINSSGSKICLDANGWHIWTNTQGRLIVNGPDESNRLLDFATVDEGINFLFMTGRQEIARIVNKAKHAA
jgi:hypothetical protein